MPFTRNPGRVAGLFYLLLGIIAPIRLAYIPAKVVVLGNATATANNIAAHERLFRIGILADLLTGVVVLCVTFALYRLLKDVNHTHAVLMVILGGLMVTPIYFINTLNDGAALTLVRGNFLSVFDKPQRDALALLFLRIHHYGVLANQIFWGLWLVPLGLLIYRSRFLPRFLGAWLIIGGIGYLAVTFTGIMYPPYEDTVGFIALPGQLAEVFTMFWLVIKGAKPQREPAQTLSAAR